MRVIASREFFDLDRPSEKYVANIYEPQPLNDQFNSWRCKFEIINAPEGFEGAEAGGSDSYQALGLAFAALEATINALNKNHLDGRLRLYKDSDQTHLLGFDEVLSGHGSV